MLTEEMRLLLVKHLRLAKAPTLLLSSPEANELDIKSQCQRLLTGMNAYPTNDPHLLLLQTRIQTMQQSDLTATDLRQKLAEEIALALKLFK